MIFDDEELLEEEIIKTEEPIILSSKPTALIYCGPSLPRGILLQYTTYRGGLPKFIQAHVEKCPAVGRLFVSPAKLDVTRRAAAKAGTAESVWYKEILKYIQGGAN